jgi:nicotinamidase-related amidase
MNNCLLLVDIQNDYFPKGKMELANMDTAAANARSLLQHYRKSGLPVVHIQHYSVRPGSTFFVPETTGVEINELVAPENGEPVVKKNFPNSFRDTALLEILQRQNINTLTICGAMSHMCIDATTRAAFDLGFRCVVAEDACATRDLVFKDRTVAAADVHASFMAALAVPYAEVIATEDILRR